MNATAAVDCIEDSASCFIVGVSISGVAAFLYASGLCVQRAALTVGEVGEAGSNIPGCDGACCFRWSTTNWVIGLLIYAVGGLFLGTLSLRYIPLSLSSSIFSSVLVFNAFVARVWLKELVQAVDIVCYLLIMAGISLDAVYLPTSPKKIDVVELSRLFREPAGIMFWVVVLSALMGLQLLIWAYLEPLHQVNSSYKNTPSNIYKLAMTAYPLVLGIWEGIAYMCLKTANDLFDRIGKGEEYNAEHWLFWFGCSISVPMILIIVVWVRKSYRRFPTTQIFPLELGALTIVSVNGGLIFFEEYKGTSAGELLVIYVGVAMMVTAMATLAFFKSQAAFGLNSNAREDAPATPTAPVESKPP